MSYTKDIVCLANSRKYGDHCVAGKEMKEGKFGEWIRPVSSLENGELPDEAILFGKGKTPGPLDVLRIPIKRHKPHKHQTENYLIEPNGNWDRVAALDPSCLDELCDKVETLWLNGESSSWGVNDRVPTEKTKRIKSSLLLIKPSKLVFCHRYEYGAGGWKTRANFVFRRVEYSLAITDPEVEEQYRGVNTGEYPAKGKSNYLTVSLGEEYNGFSYKLVAAVIFGPKK